MHGVIACGGNSLFYKCRLHISLPLKPNQNYKCYSLVHSSLAKAEGSWSHQLYVIYTSCSSCGINDKEEANIYVYY